MACAIGERAKQPLAANDELAFQGFLKSISKQAGCFVCFCLSFPTISVTFCSGRSAQDKHRLWAGFLLSCYFVVCRLLASLFYCSGRMPMNTNFPFSLFASIKVFSYAQPLLSISLGFVPTG